MTNDAPKKDIRPTLEIKRSLFFRHRITRFGGKNAYLYTRV